jgi:C_GCAxxG_C_C family probable redox protein
VEEKKSRPLQAFETGSFVEQTYGGCGQCVLYSLIENGFDISKDVFRSASGLAAGVGRQGETCGAVTGAILAISALNGREFDRIAEAAQRNKTFNLCYRFIDRFKAEYGSIRCRDIQKKLYGKEYEMSKLEDFQAFLADGGHDPQGCPAVVGNAAKWAAEVLEEDAACPREEYAMFR